MMKLFVERFVKALVLIAWLSKECSARSWSDLVDHSTYSVTMVDPYRSTSVENPFNFDDQPLETVPSSSPTIAPMDVPSLHSIFTATPSVAVNNDNLECGENESLHLIRMYDSWGDGWGETKMIISITDSIIVEEEDAVSGNTLLLDESTMFIKPLGNVFEGTLFDGHKEVFQVCLQAGKCYSVDVKGSQWQEEVKWDIRPAPSENITVADTVDTLAKGKAPMECQFSIPSGLSGKLACAFSCESFTQYPSSRPLSQSPSESPVDTPSRSSSVPSDLPSLAPSSVPSGSVAHDGPSTKSIFPSKSPTANSHSPVVFSSESSLLPSSGDTFMETMFGSSIWPTNTAYPTIAYGIEMPHGSPTESQPPETLRPTAISVGGASVNLFDLSLLPSLETTETSLPTTPSNGRVSIPATPIAIDTDSKPPTGKPVSQPMVIPTSDVNASPSSGITADSRATSQLPTFETTTTPLPTTISTFSMYPTITGFPTMSSSSAGTSMMTMSQFPTTASTGEDVTIASDISTTRGSSSASSFASDLDEAVYYSASVGTLVSSDTTVIAISSPNLRASSPSPATARSYPHRTPAFQAPSAPMDGQVPSGSSFLQFIDEIRAATTLEDRNRIRKKHYDSIRAGNR